MFVGLNYVLLIFFKKFPIQPVHCIVHLYPTKIPLIIFNFSLTCIQLQTFKPILKYLYLEFNVST
jgi:hypothetical protein